MKHNSKSKDPTEADSHFDLKDLRQFNRLYEKFKSEFDFKLFESHKGSDHSDQSVEPKPTLQDDTSDHGTPDDEDEYLAIKRRKLKNKLARKSSHSPKNSSINKANRSGSVIARNGGEKVYESPYSVAKTKPVSKTPGSIRNSKTNAVINTGIFTTNPGKISMALPEKKKVSKRLKGMSLLRVKDKFQAQDDATADDDEDEDDEETQEASVFRNHNISRPTAKTLGKDSSVRNSAFRK